HGRRGRRLGRRLETSRHGGLHLASVDRGRSRPRATRRPGASRSEGSGEVGAVTDRKDLICGNWKMNSNHLEAIQMIQKLHYRLGVEDYDRVDVVVAPPFTALRSAQTVIEVDRMRIGLGAQNVFWEDSGAYTGEVSAPMLAKLNVSYVIVGHSERREHFYES